MNIWSKIGKMIEAIELVNNDYRIGTESRVMRECLIARIVAILLEENKGLSASEMAERLDVSKTLVNSIIYKMEEYGICKKCAGRKLTWALVES